ncbi:hypothetical protein NQ318_014666, partial [Aromia moschata]
VLLPTAIIKIYDSSGKAHTVNALLDSGSQSSFLTSNFCKILKLKLQHTNLSVAGLNNAISQMQFKCNVTIESCVNTYSTQLCCYVLDEISNRVPGTEIDINKLDIPQNIKLANTNLHKPSNIDELMAADLFWSVLCTGQIKLGSNEEQIAKFWEIEEFPRAKLLSTEEKACASIFNESVQRTTNGRFLVKNSIKRQR